MLTRLERLSLVALAATVAVTGLACAPGSESTPASPSALPASSAEALAGADVTAQARPESADVMSQDGGSVYAAGGATVVRQADGLQVRVTVPTPEPGDYVYAPGFEEVGPPEVFTLWAFVFNFPELCSAPCNGDDLGADAPAKGSVYNIGGHVASGGSLTIAGRVGVGQPAAAPPGVTPTPLVNPAGAEIHVALAPHGALDPSTLPGEFRRPAGSPFCGCWWVAVFL